MAQDTKPTTLDLPAPRRRHCIVIMPQVSRATRTGRAFRAFALAIVGALRWVVTSPLRAPRWLRASRERRRARYQARLLEAIHRVVQASLTSSERERFRVGWPREIEHLARSTYRVRASFVSQRGGGFTERYVLVALSGVRWRRFLGFTPAVSLVAREFGRSLSSMAQVAGERRMVLGARTVAELGSRRLPHPWL